MEVPRQERGRPSHAVMDTVGILQMNTPYGDVYDAQ